MGNVENRVLLVDDDADLRREVGEVLRQDGWTVSEAANGQEALDQMNRGLVPRVIVLDSLMPVMDGRKFMAAVRQNALWSQIRIVQLSSAHTQIPGVTARIEKPFVLDRLQDLLRAYAEPAAGEEPKTLPGRPSAMHGSGTNGGSSKGPFRAAG